VRNADASDFLDQRAARARARDPLLEKLAQSGCSADQIAAILACERSTIERRYAAILKKGRERARGRLQVKLFQEAGT
jgi:AraC-like DNA-binding protein